VKTRRLALCVDYYLPAPAADVKLDFLDSQGKLVRAYASTDKVRTPDPALDPEAYKKLCQQNPVAPDWAGAVAAMATKGSLAASIGAACANGLPPEYSLK
jgi:hypothetical protein